MNILQPVEINNSETQIQNLDPARAWDLVLFLSSRAAF